MSGSEFGRQRHRATNEVSRTVEHSGLYGFLTKSGLYEIWALRNLDSTKSELHVLSLDSTKSGFYALLPGAAIALLDILDSSVFLDATGSSGTMRGAQDSVYIVFISDETIMITISEEGIIR